MLTARAITVNESNGRTALYIGALSSTLVALALVAQQPRLGGLAPHVAYRAHRFTRMKATVAALFPTRAGAAAG
jgi:hypothetical protein